MKPPDVYFFNQSGRYSTNTKICLNVTSYHQESWTPAWGLRTIMEAFTTFFHMNGSGIGALFDSVEKRKQYAELSRSYECEVCGKVD